MSGTSLKERALPLARKATRAPGMLTVGDISLIANAFLEAIGEPALQPRTTEPAAPAEKDKAAAKKKPRKK
jgi:hypothetical protein